MHFNDICSKLCHMLCTYQNCIFDSNRHCLAYCVVELLKKTLREFKEHWNHHKMRKTRGSACPGGVPCDLFDGLDGKVTQTLLTANISTVTPSYR